MWQVVWILVTASVLPAVATLPVPITVQIPVLTEIIDSSAILEIPASMDISGIAIEPAMTDVADSSATIDVPASTDISTTAAVPTTTDISTTAAVPTSTDSSTTAAVPTSTDISTTAASPPPTAVPRGFVPVVAGSMALALPVDAVRRKLPELQAAIAAAASVDPSAVHILSVMAGSTVVRFEIVTNSSADSVVAGLRASVADASSSLRVFAPLVESLTLTQRTAMLVFEPGWGLYICLIVAGALVLAAVAWGVYRKCRPPVVSKTLPVAEVDPTGAICIQVTSDDGAEAPVPFLKIGPQGPLTEACIVRMPTRGVLPQTDSADDVGDAESPQAPVTRLLPVVAATRGGKHRRAQPRILKYSEEVRVQESASEDSALSGESLSLPQTAPATFRGRLARLQPSREVIGDDIAASYALT